MQDRPIVLLDFPVRNSQKFKLRHYQRLPLIAFFSPLLLNELNAT